MTKTQKVDKMITKYPQLCGEIIINNNFLVAPSEELSGYRRIVTTVFSQRLTRSLHFISSNLLHVKLHTETDLEIHIMHIHFYVIQLPA